MSGLARHASRVLGWALGFAWAFFAWGKLADLALGEAPGTPTWADQFPGFLHLVVGVAEVLVAVWWFAGATGRAAPWSLGLLGLFAAALLVWPWTPGTPCGCAGDGGLLPPLDRVHPLSKNTLLAGATLLAWALGLSSARRGTGSS